jgi:hypothetical protein
LDFLAELYLQESGSIAIDWERQTHCVESSVILAGHWASLIIGRTRPNQSLAVFADSLPNYSRNSSATSREILQHTEHAFRKSLGYLLELNAGGGTICGVCAYSLMLYMRGL